MSSKIEKSNEKLKNLNIDYIYHRDSMLLEYKINPQNESNPKEINEYLKKAIDAISENFQLKSHDTYKIKISTNEKYNDLMRSMLQRSFDNSGKPKIEKYKKSFKSFKKFATVFTGITITVFGTVALYYPVCLVLSYMVPWYTSCYTVFLPFLMIFGGFAAITAFVISVLIAYLLSQAFVFLVALVLEIFGITACKQVNKKAEIYELILESLSLEKLQDVGNSINKAIGK